MRSVGWRRCRPPRRWSSLPRGAPAGRYPVPGHCDLMSLPFQSSDKFLFLFRRHPGKDRVFLTQPVIVRIFSLPGHIHSVPPSLQPRALCHHGYGFDMVPGNDFDVHSFFSEKLQRLCRTLPDRILQYHAVQRNSPRRKLCVVLPLPSIISDDDQPPSFIQFLFKLFRKVFHKTFRSSHEDRTRSF